MQCTSDNKLPVVQTAANARIKIVGVQFAANPEHIQGTPMSKNEEQKTLSLLTQLQTQKPEVTLRLDPQNTTDHDAIVVRFHSRKVGYVRNTPENKARAHAALQKAGHVRARVVQVEVMPQGWFYVELPLQESVQIRDVITSPWEGWEPNVPPMPLTEQMKMVDDAVDELHYLLMQPQHPRLVEELTVYVQVICTHGRHVLCNRVKRELEQCCLLLEGMEGKEIRLLSEVLEHHLVGMCSDTRLAERRTQWLPLLQLSNEAETTWHNWLHTVNADIGEANRDFYMCWLADVDYTLANIPAIAPCQSDDDTTLLTRAYYTNITQQAMQKLLALIVVRHRLQAKMNEPVRSECDISQAPSRQPAVLFTPRAMEMWQKLQHEGFVDASCMPIVTKENSENKFAIIASVMGGLLNLPTKWKPFEELWGRKEWCNKLAQAQTCNYYADFYKFITRLLE